MSNTESIASKSWESGLGEALQKRILRGIEHYGQCEESIEWVAEDRCKVPSQRFPKRSYLVIFGKDGERCQCYDFSRSRLGACKHTAAALISWAKGVDYRVDKRHDSRREDFVWDVVETRAGVDRVVGTFAYVGSAYHAKWALEGCTYKEAA